MNQKNKCLAQCSLFFRKTQGNCEGWSCKKWEWSWGGGDPRDGDCVEVILDKPNINTLYESRKMQYCHLLNIATSAAHSCLLHVFQRSVCWSIVAILMHPSRVSSQFLITATHHPTWQWDPACAFSLFYFFLFFNIFWLWSWNRSPFLFSYFEPHQRIYIVLIHASHALLTHRLLFGGSLQVLYLTDTFFADTELWIVLTIW